jgi:hypothetical protein
VTHPDDGRPTRDGSGEVGGRRPRWRLRAAINWANLSTPLGLALARAAGARVGGPDPQTRLRIADGYRWPVPPAPIFTFGNVLLARDASRLARDRRLLAHESRHATQYAWCLGPLMLVPYVLAGVWSWLRTGSFALANVFEVRAGLEDGGYLPRRGHAGEPPARRRPRPHG